MFFCFAVTKYSLRSGLREEGFISAHSFRLYSLWLENHGSRSEQLGLFTLHDAEQEAEGREEGGQTIEQQALLQVTPFVQVDGDQLF